MPTWWFHHHNFTIISYKVEPIFLSLLHLKLTTFLLIYFLVLLSFHHAVCFYLNLTSPSFLTLLLYSILRLPAFFGLVFVLFIIFVFDVAFILFSFFLQEVGLQVFFVIGYRLLGFNGERRYEFV